MVENLHDPATHFWFSKPMKELQESYSLSNWEEACQSVCITLFLGFFSWAKPPKSQREASPPLQILGPTLY